MSGSLRTRRLSLYRAVDLGAAGRTVSAYAREFSDASDGDWWGSVATPTGREALVAMREQESIDAVIGLAAEAPAVRDGVAVDQFTGRLYRLTAVMERGNGADERQCFGVAIETPRLLLVDAEHLILASAQTAGSQVVTALQGDDGVFGDDSSAEASDPSLVLTAPSHWLFGGGDKWLHFGQSLRDVFRHSSGYTIVAAVNFGSTINDGSGTVEAIFHAMSDTFAAPAGFCSFYGFNGVLWMDQYYAQDVARWEDANGGTIAPGRYVVSAHFDRSLAFGARLGLWLNGSALAVTHNTMGAAGSVDPVGLDAQWGALPGWGVASCDALHAGFITSGVLTAQQQADWANLFRTRGWV